MHQTPTDLELDDEGLENEEGNNMEDDHEPVGDEEVNPFSSIPKVQPSSKPVASGSGACLGMDYSDDSNLNLPFTASLKLGSTALPIGPPTKLPCASGKPSPKVLAWSVNLAVKEEKYQVQAEHSLAVVKKDIALAKLDKFPNHKTVMVLFNTSSAAYFEDPLACMAAAEDLFDEDKAN
ncbi:hypothetical protein CROQUDRAFT_102250 [Cronartium quercuum f. sp. fusiforme G11]|uniref:Uncharacterized protein n=1 Tax=Cronartium quercuum f. sp. fusiforme G11 TaxID=708437 RepID=A0A9P6N4U9_9BASI|nr:hypothetical protein CROQUDRAFT_102250 [Cronartium quercuum f. sp. fusiforme G11]